MVTAVFDFDIFAYRAASAGEKRQKELNDSVEYAKRCLDTFLKNQPKYDTEGGILSKAWNNVKERHWDTIKRMGDK